VTGSPPEFLLTSMTLELVAFVALFSLLLKLTPRNLLAAPLAYLVGRAVVTGSLWLADGTPSGTWSALGASLQTAWPGIVILTLVGAALVLTTRRSNRA